MSQYEIVRQEFHNLQNAGNLSETRITAIEVVRNGQVVAGHALPHGLNGVCTYKRQDGTLTCEEAFLGGAVDGYARYYNSNGELVGEDYYEQGGVTQTRVFR
jgi:antitoxin component YwqK of YwqJK toxin-antitoxin module